MSSPDQDGGADSGDAEHRTDARLIELEIKLGFAEDLLEELNRTIYRQQQEIEQLQRAIRELREQLPASLPAEQKSLKDELPPHY